MLILGMFTLVPVRASHGEDFVLWSVSRLIGSNCCSRQRMVLRNVENLIERAEQTSDAVLFMKR